MKNGIQKKIGAKVGLKPNFFNDIIHEREKCPAKYALLLPGLTGIPVEIWIDPEPAGKRKKAWSAFLTTNKKNKRAA